MRGVNKLCGVLLALFTISLLTLSQCSDTNALQHSYVSIPLLNECFPNPTYDSESGKYILNWDSPVSSLSDCSSRSAPFLIEIKGDSFTSSPKMLYSSSYMTMDFDNGNCLYSSLNPQFQISTDSNGFSWQANTPNYFDSSKYTNISGVAKCYSLNKFNTNGTPDFQNSSIPTGLLSCSSSNGAVCGGLWNTREYINENLLPYWFTQNGAYMQDKYIDTDGFHYSNSFSFNQIFDTPIYKFSKLQVPLWTDDSYFYNSDNFISGRPLEYKIAFEFDGSFQWNPNINNNGSSSYIDFSGYRADTGSLESFRSDCTANLITVSDLTRVEFSCPLSLQYDYLAVFPAFVIDGNNYYVWNTDNNWRFSYLNLITDNDTTKGESFGSNVVGGNPIIGSAKSVAENSNNNAIIIDGKDLTSSLVNLFGFNFLNPFAPLFQLFTNQDSCVHIPIIAGMLHSESDEVCPWFPATVRNIATPVMGIASVMLVFGFAVRWLGAGSGNLLDDVIKNDTVKGGK